MVKTLIIYNPKESHHHYRLVMGLQACENSVTVCEKLPTNYHDFDYIFVEHSLNEDLSCLSNFKGIIIPFDMEDSPRFFSPGIGFHSVKDFCTVYAKYNYQEHNNPTGLKLIAAPQIDYINKGAVLAQYVYPQRNSVSRFKSVFLFGTPTYLTEYQPKQNANYINNEDISSCVKCPTEDFYLYHQRLEWLYMLSKSDVSYSGGLNFDKSGNPDHPYSMEYQSKLFGQGCKKFLTNPIPAENYYVGFLSHPIAPCPAGHARSSYRIIELMALGRIILQTDMENYKYLYNPVSFITVPDGEDISVYAQKCLEDEENLLNECKKNVEVFSTLTPQKMFKDFINQI